MTHVVQLQIVNMCSTCGIETKNRKFCSRTCSAITTNSTHPRRKRIIRHCLGCAKEIRNLSYCSISCNQNHRYLAYIKQWQCGEVTGCTRTGKLAHPVRRWIKERDGNKCTQCGWAGVHPITGNVMVQVDHIDGNFMNCRPENLRLLCPNCHSLTPTFMALNVGNGRSIQKRKINGV